MDKETNKGNFLQLIPKIKGLEGEVEMRPDDNEGLRQIRGVQLQETVQLSPSNYSSFRDGILADPELQSLLTQGLQIQKVGEINDEGNVAWDIQGNITWKKKIVVPNYHDLRLHIVKDTHDSLLAGHPGISKTLALVSRNYYWPGMATYITNYIKTCETCGRHKARRHNPYGHLESLPVAYKPWTELSMDFIGPLPTSHGMNSILVVVDRFTKGAHFIGTTTTATSKDVADMIIREIVSKHGLPKSIVSDRGTEFTSDFWKEFTKQLQIHNHYSTAYHPQTDGQTERINQILEEYLSLYTNYQMHDWSQLLPIAEMVYNNSPSATTGISPFLADHGYEMTFDPSTFSKRPFSTKSNTIVTDIQQLHTVLHEQIQNANTKMAKQYNKKHLPVPADFEVGKKVYLST